MPRICKHWALTAAAVWTYVLLLPHVLSTQLSPCCCVRFSLTLLLVAHQQVTIDNESFDDRTIITVDSANRPGTLVEVVQCLTELGLNVKRARISSDGGWFVDEFHVTETAGPMQQVGRQLNCSSRAGQPASR